MGVKFKAFRWADSSRAIFSRFCILVFERRLGGTWLQLPNFLVTVPCTSALFVLEGRDILGTFLLEKCRAKIIIVIIIIVKIIAVLYISCDVRYNIYVRIPVLHHFSCRIAA